MNDTLHDADRFARKYLRIDTGQWSARSEMPIWGRVLALLFPKANPNIEHFYSQVQYWWLEIDAVGAPLREIGFDEDGNAIVLAPIANNYGMMIDASDDWSEFEGESPEATKFFEREWRRLWPKFACLEPDKSYSAESYEDYARRLFWDFMENGALPDRLETRFAFAGAENSQLDTVMHYLAHVVTDRDERMKNSELDQIMRQELRVLIENLGDFLAEDTWQTFVRVWLQAMVGCQNNQLTMDEASSRVTGVGVDIDPEIVQFACDAISEIDGHPEDYAETISLLQSGPSEADVQKYMNA